MPVIDVVFRGPHRGEAASTHLTDHDGWPTTQRFSRRCGEKLHDAQYAAAVERPPDRVLAGTVVAATVIAALFGAVAIVLWQAP